MSYFANYPRSLIGIEARGGAQHWAREFTTLGYQVILLNARFVIGNKNDFNDAADIFEAVSRPNRREVAIKTIDEQDIQMIHN